MALAVSEFGLWWPDPLVERAPTVRLAQGAENLSDLHYLSLMFVVGGFWLAAYVLAILRANVDERTGLPAIAVAFNFAWELNYSLIVFHAEWQRPFNFAWLLLDVYIVRQILRFGPKDHPDLSQREFKLMFFATLAFAVLFLPAVTLDIDDHYGAFTGLGVNCLMSLLFIRMLRRRRSSAGQSMYVALCKGIGSLLGVAMSLSLYPYSYVIAVLGAWVIAMDAVYAVALYRRIRAEGQSPWDHNRPKVVDEPAPRDGDRPAMREPVLTG